MYSALVAVAVVADPIANFSTLPIMFASIFASEVLRQHCIMLRGIHGIAMTRRSGLLAFVLRNHLLSTPTNVRSHVVQGALLLPLNSDGFLV